MVHKAGVIPHEPSLRCGTNAFAAKKSLSLKQNLFRMSVFFEGVGGREVELQRLLLQDFCDAATVSLQLHLRKIFLKIFDLRVHLPH